MIIVGNYTEMIEQMIKKLFAKYGRRNHGVPNKLVGVSFTATDEGIVLDQSRYAKSIVLEGMDSTDVRKVHIPLDHGMNLTATEER